MSRPINRLLEVLRSVNGTAIGEDEAFALQMARCYFLDRQPLSSKYRGQLEVIAREHSSPHIRELAAEALAVSP